MRIPVLAAIVAALLAFSAKSFGEENVKPTELTGVPLSLVYAAKMDGPNPAIAFTVMLRVAGKPVPAIFEGQPQHPVLDALATIQAEINDGDDESITIHATLLGSVPNASYPHGIYVIKDIRVGDYFWKRDYFKYKG